MENISLSYIRDGLKTIRHICTKHKIISLNRQIEVCEGLLTENPRIDVAILGQFKAGKSSFINNIIGENILPVGVIPVTTVITRIQYGKKRNIVVKYFDGTKSEINPDDIEVFTSEAKNPANRKNVEVVDIELPSLGGFEGLRLVDTPGLGSIFKYHRKTSENWLPEVGATLLAVSSDRPLSDYDLELIRNLTQHTPKIALLLTKVDILTPEQRIEMVEFVKQALERELEVNIPVYLYSTRSGTEQFKHRLEKDFLSYLSANRDFELKNILKYKIRSLAESCSSYLDIALKTSLKSDSDRENLRLRILNEKVNYDLIENEISIIINENKRQTLGNIKNHLEPLYPFVRKRLIENLRKEMSTWEGNLWKLTRSYEKWLSDSMTEEMTRISEIEYEHFLYTLNTAHASLSRALINFRRLLDENIQKVLGVKLAEVEWKIDIVNPGKPDIKTPWVFDYHLDLMWFLIPMFVFRKFFEKNFISKVPWETEINLQRLASKWEIPVNRAIEHIKEYAIRYIKDELATIDVLVSETHGNTEKICGAISEIKNLLHHLEIRSDGSETKS